jgi:hypothetical protein
MRPLLLFLVLFCFSCQKSNLNDFPEFEGYWLGTDSNANYVIDVKEDGQASYTKKTKDTESFSSGTLKVSGDNLKIGVSNFKIDEHPNQHPTTGKWIMKVDNVPYIRR